MRSPAMTRAAAAASSEESRPPLVNTPTGTSDMSSRSTDASSTSRRSARRSRGGGPEPLIQRHDRLDVARRTERIPRMLAFLAQRRRVVDLAVADHPDRVVGTLERLVAGGEVHDGEAARAEAGPLVAHDALAVGAAVREGGGHRADAAGVPQRCTGERDGAEEAAHYRTALPPPRLGGCGGW